VTRLTHLDVPDHLHRNAPSVAAAGFEQTGQLLLNLVQNRCGLETLANTQILDVGCGVRFTMTIINRRIPIQSYAGLEVEKPIVDFLRDNVAALDDRFKFIYWNAHNEKFNPGGVSLSSFATLPDAGAFDLIFAFSVFTHLAPHDSLAMLRLLRRHIRPKGKLFFSAFIDDDLDGFEDRVKGSPLENAYYGRLFMESLIQDTGWSIDGFFDRDPASAIMHSFLCSPSGDT